MSDRPPRTFYLAMGLLPVLLSLLIIEAGGRIFLLLWPAYDVLFLQPDRAVGWKQVPGWDWTWAGVHWYARDFSVSLKTNAHGFRDRERGETKVEGVVRVALLGDSLVEALQVPLEQTAGQLLEGQLNATASSGRRYEVLNFGISNYGIGQYLLVWEEYASRFDPDYVFIFVAAFNFQRTVTRHEVGRFHHSTGRTLWIRPTFRLEGEKLVREPAGDYDEFVAAQQVLIDQEFGGSRSRQRASSVIGYLVGELWPWPALPHPSGALPAVEQNPGLGLSATGSAIVEVNLRIIEELGRQVSARGGRLVVADACAYFPDPQRLCQTLESFCVARNLGYVPLGQRLRAANHAGRSTRWAHDGHFNEAGNQVYAEAMDEWMKTNGAPR